jgi:uncharacterized repeat protein (TIGR03917 family)
MTTDSAHDTRTEPSDTAADSDASKDMIATLIVEPGQSLAELAATLARLPAELEFSGAFGDSTIILVYGPPGAPLPEATMLAVVAATLGDWG